MTVKELIAKLDELPEALKDVPVLIESDEGGRSELTSVRAQIDNAKIWWEPDAVVLSTTY